MTTLFIATKVEEQRRKLREIVLVFDRLIKLRNNAALTLFVPESQRFTKWRDQIQVHYICFCFCA